MCCLPNFDDFNVQWSVILLLFLFMIEADHHLRVLINESSKYCLTIDLRWTCRTELTPDISRSGLPVDRKDSAGRSRPFQIKTLKYEYNSIVCSGDSVL